MAITANVDLGNGVTTSSSYIIIPEATVLKDDSGNFKLVYDIEIYENSTKRVDRPEGSKLYCRAVDKDKIDYDTETNDNPFKLAYTHLKTNSKLSSVADA
jgi:hypothetical protein